MKNVEKNNPPPLFGSKILNLLVSFDFEAKKCFRVPTPWGLYGAEWDGPCAGYAPFSHFCDVGSFDDLPDPELPTLRGVTGDVVTIYA